MSTADVTSSDSSNIHSILGEVPDSEKLSRFLQGLARGIDGTAATEGLLKPDTDGSRAIKQEDIHSEKLKLDSICIYNALESPSTTTAKTYATYPSLPITLPLLDTSKQRSAQEVVLSTNSTGKDIVALLGEPSRKGGGSGPSSGSIGIWCEWTKDGIMVEFGGDEAKGPKAWETGKNAKWKIVTLFKPS